MPARRSGTAASARGTGRRRNRRAVSARLAHLVPDTDQEPPPAPPGYHPHIDVNGDGHWDAYTVHGRAGGGVDVYADMNHDGRVDFVGHDYNADGRIDAADYDKDHDGVFENHQFDTNGDGWLDRSVTDPTPPTPPVPPTPPAPPVDPSELRFGAPG